MRQFPEQETVYTIRELNARVRYLLEEAFMEVWVRGEISDLTKPSSGHLYFILKDTHAQIRCAVFKNRAFGLRCTPENGMNVIIHANMSLYEARGDYQLIVKSITPDGLGVLEQQYAALKAKLEKEGLFDIEHKKPLPAYPQKIGVISSPTGAALFDILSVLKRRYAYAEVTIYPTAVQGADAVQEIIRAISIARERNESEVLILSRGGGSLEDMMAFNHEDVARAVFLCHIPIVSGVGHEINHSIVDFVADRRAATPSAAAELVSPDTATLAEQLCVYRKNFIHLQQQRLVNLNDQLALLTKSLQHPAQRLQQLVFKMDDYALRLNHNIRHQITQNRKGLMMLQNQILQHHPLGYIAQCQYKLNNTVATLLHTIKQKIQDSHHRLAVCAQKLESVSPLATLKRGYAIVSEKKYGRIIRDSAELKIGMPLSVKLSKGEIEVSVDALDKK